VRKCNKWTTKLAFHFLEESVFNAFVIYKQKEKEISFKIFKINLVHLLIKDVVADPPHQLPRKIGKHFLIPIPSTS